MEQAQDSKTTGHKPNHTGQMVKALAGQKAKADVADCPECGGRGWLVQPGIKGNWSMPCPQCGPYAA